jgi:F-type H+-transporting ATPase subunit delta
VGRGGAARRYARALFELAKEQGRSEAVRGELATLAGLLAERDDLRRILLEPLHPVVERRAVLSALVDRIGGGPLLRNFLCFLVDQRRVVHFEGIRQAYEELADRDAGVCQARIVAASPLRPDQLERIRQALAARSGGEVRVRVEVDPELIGGVVAQLGDVVYDGSLRTQLGMLRASLTGR